jgi:hypothetical protein
MFALKEKEKVRWRLHKVKIIGVRTLETSKFDGESGLMTNPPKATIKWPENTPLTEAAIFNNTEAWLLTDAEKQALTEGKDWLMPESLKQRFKTVIASMMDLLSDSDEKAINENG